MNNFETFAPLAVDERQRLLEIGGRWARDIHGHRDAVLSIYSPLLARAPKADVCVQRDQAYGPHARQLLDVFAPIGAQDCDVALFVHGGAFVRGNKRVNDEVYDNLGYWFARQGVVLVNMEYRLAGEAPYPAGALDVQLAVQWCSRHIAASGGNPRRIALIGHSAGGTHVASYLADPVVPGGPSPDVIGAVSLSGRLRADVRPDNPNAGGVRVYFGADASLHEQRSPVTHAHRVQVPFLVAVAEYENPYLDAYGMEFAMRYATAHGRAPEFVCLPGHNHTSMFAHFNSGEVWLGQRILDFIHACS